MDDTIYTNPMPNIWTYTRTPVKSPSKRNYLLTGFIGGVLFSFLLARQFLHRLF